MSDTKKLKGGKEKGFTSARPKLGGRALIVAILGLGLVFKLYYLLSYSSSSPYYNVARMDSGVYVDWARSINQEGWLGHEVFYQAPLYPYLLSVIFRVFGDGFLSVYLIQVLMGMGILALIYLTGKMVYGERAGVVAALLCVSYAPFTMYETKVLTTVTEMFLALLAMYFLVRAEQEGKRRYWTAGATALGLAIICRPNYGLVLPIMLLVLAVRNRTKLAEIFQPMLVLVLIPSMIIGTVTFRNYLVGKDFVPISSSAGVTFAQGNNALARGSMVMLPGFSSSPASQRQEEKQIAEKETGRPLKPSETSAFWLRKALRFIEENPLDYLRLLLDKTLLVFSNREVGSNYLMSVEEALTPCLKLAFMPFGIIMAWAIVGLLASFRRGLPDSVLISAFFGAFLMLLLFFVNTRFRMTVAPAAAIMAGGGMDYLLSDLSDKKRTIWTLVTAGFAFIVSLPPFLPLGKTQLMRGDEKYWANLIVAFEMNGQMQKALWACDKAIEADPHQYRNYLKKAGLLEVLRADKEEMVSWTEATTEKFPSEAKAHMMLADAYRATGSDDKAIQSYRKVIALTPMDAEAYLRLGALLGKRGDHLRAKSVFEEGLKVSPENIHLQYNLAVASLISGEKEEALAWLKRVMSKDPEYAQAYRLLQQLEGKKQ